MSPRRRHRCSTLGLVYRANVDQRTGADGVIDVMAVEDDLACRQNGFVTWAQLLDAGLTPAQVRWRVATGRLYRKHRGVYGVTDPRLLPSADEAAARQGIRIHRVARLDPRDVTTKGSLRITAPARSAIDFATDAPLPELEHALSEARA